MNGILLLFGLLVFCGIQIAKSNTFHNDYCGVKKTNAIKGIFVLIIMLCHFADYVAFDEKDLWLHDMSVYLKQLNVVPILFYSGFGIMESIQRKGIDYVRAMPVQNIMKTFVWADISVLVFAAFYLLCGIHVTPQRLLLSLVFWESIENNTWYFFVIIILYALTWVSFLVFKRNHFVAAAVMTVLSFVPFFILTECREIFWYNTFFVYHFGLWFSLLRRQVEKIVMKNDLMYVLAMAFAFAGYLFFRGFGSFYYFIICSCFFMMCIVGMTMKVSIDNPFLQFLGKHVFAFYVFQRLPMFMLSNSPMENWEKFILSVLITAVFALMFEHVAIWLDRYVFKKLLMNLKHFNNNGNALKG